MLFEELSVNLPYIQINQRFRAFLPATWKQLNKEDHEKFIGKFDKKGKGEIELWILFTVIALSNCRLPNEK